MPFIVHWSYEHCSSTKVHYAVSLDWGYDRQLDLAQARYRTSIAMCIVKLMVNISLISLYYFVMFFIFGLIFDCKKSFIYFSTYIWMSV